MSAEQILAEVANLPMEERSVLITRLMALGQKAQAEKKAGERSVFERLQSLSVNDPASLADLATNPAHLEGFGVSRSA